MLKLSTWKRCEFSNGVSAELKPLDRKGITLMMPYIISPVKPGDTKEKVAERLKNRSQEEIVKDAETMYEVQSVSKDILGNHIRDIEGVEIDGEPIESSVLSSDIRLATLAFEMIATLVTLSQVPPNEEKNSEKLSDLKAQEK